MSVRLIISISATSGNGSHLGQELKHRSVAVREEPGCEQYEVFQSLDDPDLIVLLEKWQDPLSLDAHARLMQTRPPIDRALVAGVSQREDYDYNRTR